MRCFGGSQRACLRAVGDAPWMGMRARLPARRPRQGASSAIGGRFRSVAGFGTGMGNGDLCGLCLYKAIRRNRRGG
eukprot:365592-Chlamydomonas_euryale.AAC.10